jgi:flagellin
MQINHNINAMITQHALRNNNSAMGKSLEKLSTGLKINRAQDDAAGLAMSEQMRTQIRGLGKAKQNSQDGIAALQIAEGGLAEITSIMQRQRELAIQSANDTLTSTERKYLDLEFQELTKEIARIAKTTDYNGKNMLNWAEDPNLSFGAVGNKYELQGELQDEAKKLQELAGKATGVPLPLPSSLTTAISNLAALAAIPPTNAAAINGAYTAFINSVFTDNPPPPYYDKADDGYYKNSALKTDVDTFLADPTVAAKDKELASQLKERLENMIKSNAPPAADSLTNLYYKMVVNDMTNAASYTLHIGPNYAFGMGGKWANEMTITYISLNPGSLGLATKNIRTQNNSTEVIDHLDKIIKSVSGVRAKIGTYINRLEYTINNIASLEFNTQDAESRIRDTDFAESTTQFTRNQILVQSATSMLAQANTLPQTALTLING